MKIIMKCKALVITAHKGRRLMLQELTDLPNWVIATIVLVGIFSLTADWQDWFMGD